MTSADSNPVRAVSSGVGPRAASTPEGRVETTLDRRQREFVEVLGRVRSGPSDAVQPEERARRVAEDFVAAAFIEPVLKQLRESNTGAAPFAPGPGEQQFRGLMDAQVARQISRAARFPLVNRLAHDLLKKSATTAPGAPTPIAPGMPLNVRAR